MFLFRKPTFIQLKEYLSGYADAPFTYDEVGGTRESSPKAYSRGHCRVKLGHGRPTFLRAKQSLQDWRMFPEKFVELVWPVPFEAGRVVATLFRAPGFWTLNPCRIVYTIDDMGLDADNSVERFGFAYGTVGDHLASGEERFTVEYDRADESVWYEVYCFSRTRHWLADAAYPYLRFQQHRFRRLSGRAMQAAVHTPAKRRRAPPASRESLETEEGWSGNDLL